MPEQHTLLGGKMHQVAFSNEAPAQLFSMKHGYSKGFAALLFACNLAADPNGQAKAQCPHNSRLVTSDK